ncbi:alpha/beta hydrolase [Zhihengliuella flava]|uniref:Dienelactone hydrolase n=1 Tax=Zhihengliuella flava TaxID=1285193 RepID=A0A931D9P9_9MICC|nr:hypothetical protein [Zhihengliuella flava]MBG6085012.1 dienelactone hydrolase [Zhihengliuella flava]
MDHSSPPPTACTDPSLGRGAEPLLLRVRQDPPSPAAATGGATSAVEHLGQLSAAFAPYLRPEPPRLLEESAHGDWVRQRWSAEIFPGMPFGVYVLRPTGPGPSPTVLALHGHGASSASLAGVDDDGATAGAHGRLGVQLVEAGATVVIPDMVGLPGRRGAAERPGTQCQRLVNHLGLFGLSLSGARTAELNGLLGQLAELEVDPSAPLGVAGFSGGGQIGVHVALPHPQVRVLALSGYGSTFAQGILAIEHCPCNYTPGLARFGDLPEVLAAFTGPIIVEAGRADQLFPIGGVRATADALARLGRSEPGHRSGDPGAPPPVTLIEHDGGHEVDGPALTQHVISALKNISCE